MKLITETNWTRSTTLQNPLHTALMASAPTQSVMHALPDCWSVARAVLAVSTAGNTNATSTLASANCTSQFSLDANMPHKVRSNFSWTTAIEKFTPSICMFKMSSLVAIVEDVVATLSLVAVIVAAKSLLVRAVVATV